MDNFGGHPSAHHYGAFIYSGSWDSYYGRHIGACGVGPSLTVGRSLQRSALPRTCNKSMWVLSGKSFLKALDWEGSKQPWSEQLNHGRVKNVCLCLHPPLPLLRWAQKKEGMKTGSHHHFYIMRQKPSRRCLRKPKVPTLRKESITRPMCLPPCLLCQSGNSNLWPYPLLVNNTWALS